MEFMTQLVSVLDRLLDVMGKMQGTPGTGGVPGGGTGSLGSMS